MRTALYLAFRGSSSYIRPFRYHVHACYTGHYGLRVRPSVQARKVKAVEVYQPYSILVCLRHLFSLR